MIKSMLAYTTLTHRSHFTPSNVMLYNICSLCHRRSHALPFLVDRCHKTGRWTWATCSILLADFFFCKQLCDQIISSATKKCKLQLFPSPLHHIHWVHGKQTMYFSSESRHGARPGRSRVVIYRWRPSVYKKNISLLKIMSIPANVTTVNKAYALYRNSVTSICWYVRLKEYIWSLQMSLPITTS